MVDSYKPPLRMRLAAIALILSPILAVAAFVMLALDIQVAYERVEALETALSKCRADCAHCYEPDPAND